MNEVLNCYFDMLCSFYFQIIVFHFLTLNLLAILTFPPIFLKGVFAKNERGYRLSAIKKRF